MKATPVLEAFFDGENSVMVMAEDELLPQPSQPAGGVAQPGLGAGAIRAIQSWSSVLNRQLFSLLETSLQAAIESWHQPSHSWLTRRATRSSLSSSSRGDGIGLVLAALIVAGAVVYAINVWSTTKKETAPGRNLQQGIERIKEAAGKAIEQRE